MEPATQEELPSRKRLALFLDGTWNTSDTNTNVWRMRSLCAERGRDGLRQLRYYDVGLNGVSGGGWGMGLSDNIKEAYNWLVENYEWNDDIFVFGFSRGAYTARSLAGFVTMCGLLKPGGALGVDQLYERYRRKEDQERTIYELMTGKIEDPTPEEAWMLRYSRAVPIKMVGVWDTVGAVGIPVGHWRGISASTLGFFATGLRQPIKNAFHAIAIDEHRPRFAPTLWTVRGGLDVPRPQPRSISSVEQRWFVGAHGNVGGGYYTDLLAQIPLRWMMKKASSLGLALRNELEPEKDEVRGEIPDSYRAFLGGWYRYRYPRLHRAIQGSPERTATGLHYTVNETIDASVFERYRLDTRYRPPNLQDWIKERGVDMAVIHTAVRADDPTVSVPD